MLSEAALASFIAALFSMMNPIGGVAVFAGMTADRSAAEAKRIAWTSAAAIAVTLLIVTWAGASVMAFFGVTVDSLRTAGGLVVLLIGLHMLFNKAEHKHSDAELDEAKTGSPTSIAVIPMAIPIVAGPGTMTTVLVAAQRDPSVLARSEISIVVLAMAVLCGILFSFAQPIANRLGESGVGVVTRIMGLILAAIASGMLTDGLRVLLPGLAG